MTSTRRPRQRPSARRASHAHDSTMAWGNAAAWSERVRATRKISPRPSRAMSIAVVGRARVRRRARISRDDASAAPRAMDDRDDRRASDAMRDGTRGMTREWDDGKCVGSIDRSIEGARAERARRGRCGRFEIRWGRWGRRRRGRRARASSALSRAKATMND